MEIKRIVVLANSVKHNPGRCIAGRETALENGVPRHVGGWVRPVSSVGEGQLYSQHCTMADGGSINLLDIVEVPLVKKMEDPTQPENWLVDDHTRWKKIGAWPRARLAELYDDCENLWLERNARPDRVSQAHFAAHPPKQSLYLIPLAKTAFVGEGRHRRLLFHYGEHIYSLKITDPLLSADQARAAPVAGCISIAPPFKGHHYKLVASLFW